MEKSGVFGFGEPTIWRQRNRFRASGSVVRMADDEVGFLRREEGRQISWVQVTRIVRR